MAQKIYLADDEENIRNLIATFLSKEGFEIKKFENGEILLNECINDPPNLVILDIMMPGTDGLSICSLLRKTYPDLPIIIVSAKDSPYDRVTGLTLGSDDYLVKPFLPLELVARVHALLRRSQKSNTYEQKLIYGSLQIFPERKEATLNEKTFSLTPTEFDFLVYLCKNQERAISKEELLHALWQIEWKIDTRATDDLVKRLRRKLKNQNSSIKIETVWGFGYRLSMEENK